MKKILFILLMVPMIWACSSKNELSTKPSTITLNATIDIPLTKMSPANLSGSTVYFNWNEGDVVKVAKIGGTEIQTFSIINSSIDNVNHKASFSGTALEGGMDSYFVFYNYPDDWIMEIITTGEISATTTPRAGYYEDSFRPFAAAANGTSDGFTIDTFMPVLHLNLKGSVAVKRIDFCRYNQDIVNDMLLPGEDGLQLNTVTATSVYLPIINPPDGFYIKFYDKTDNLIMSKKVNSSVESEPGLELEEGNIYNMPELVVATPTI